jgi:hypothetical protein
MGIPRDVRFTPLATELRTSPEVRFVPHPDIAMLPRPERCYGCAVRRKASLEGDDHVSGRPPAARRSDCAPSNAKVMML